MKRIYEEMSSPEAANPSPSQEESAEGPNQDSEKTSATGKRLKKTDQGISSVDAGGTSAGTSAKPSRFEAKHQDEFEATGERSKQTDQGLSFVDAAGTSAGTSAKRSRFEAKHQDEFEATGERLKQTDRGLSFVDAGGTSGDVIPASTSGVQRVEEESTDNSYQSQSFLVSAPSGTNSSVELYIANILLKIIDDYMKGNKQEIGKHQDEFEATGERSKQTDQGLSFVDPGGTSGEVIPASTSGLQRVEEESTDNSYQSQSFLQFDQQPSGTNSPALIKILNESLELMDTYTKGNKQETGSSCEAPSLPHAQSTSTYSYNYQSTNIDNEDQPGTSAITDTWWNLGDEYAECNEQQIGSSCEPPSLPHPQSTPTYSSSYQSTSYENEDQTSR